MVDRSKSEKTLRRGTSGLFSKKASGRMKVPTRSGSGFCLPDWETPTEEASATDTSDIKPLGSRKGGGHNLAPTRSRSSSNVDGVDKVWLPIDQMHPSQPSFVKPLNTRQGSTHVRIEQITVSECVS